MSQARAIASLLVVVVVPTLAWWDAGHMMVSTIALSNMKTDRAAVAEQFANVLAADFPTSPDFVTSAVWADDIRGLDFSVFGTWHYITLPYVPVPMPDVPATPTAQTENTAVWLINNAITNLSGKFGEIWGRSIMIRLLIHMGGDVHQPMHAVSLFRTDGPYRLPPPSGDAGGNFFHVYINNPKRTSTNLHSVWDSVAYKYANITLTRPLSGETRNVLNGMANAITTRYPQSYFTEAQLNNSNAYSWAQESHDLAVQYAYLNGTLLPNANLTAEYVQNVIDIAEMRIALAGYRLARIFDAVLPQTGPVYPSPSSNPNPSPSPSPPASSPAPPAQVPADHMLIPRSTVIGAAVGCVCGGALIGGVVAAIIIKIRRRVVYSHLTNQ